MIPETGWYAHVEYDVVRAETHVYLTYAEERGKRHIVHFASDGTIQFSLMGFDEPKPKPTFSGGHTTAIIDALTDAARRSGFLPDRERELSAELSGVRGELGYAKQITDRLLSHLLDASDSGV